MKQLIALILSITLWNAPAFAQAKDSIFENYEDYSAFVDAQVMKRDFIPLIQRLGGRDEFTTAQLIETNTKLRAAWPIDFSDKTVMRSEDLGGGVWQEGRLYWNGLSYAYFYALIHKRADAFVVLSFHLNTSAEKIMTKF